MKNTGKVREKSGKFVSLKKWESWKMYVKMKELGPVRECAGHVPLDLPMEWFLIERHMIIRIWYMHYKVLLIS